jgi:hypothetical protein
LLDCFGGQGVAIRSAVATIGAGPDQAIVHRLSDAGRSVADHTVVPMAARAIALETLARKAAQVCAGTDGADLLVLSEAELATLLMHATGDLPFRAVAVSRGTGDARATRKPQRDLFDRGLVSIGLVATKGQEARCYLASDAVQAPNTLRNGSPHRVTVSCLGTNGRFANQLFQYAYAKLYALRHGATAAIPLWQGNELFGLHDPPCAGLALPQRTFAGFDDRHRQLWDEDDPPIDIDLNGYFQELPDCWQRHRPLLRRFFQLSPERQAAVDAWHRQVTRAGERTLVAVHVRRGDYRIQPAGMPWFRLVPEEWYVDWLRRIWPTLREPLLFVATDEPEVVRPHFAEFASVSADFPAPASELPDHVRDFEALRRADYLALCNSSFSLMAAILAPASQQCFIPSFERQEFERYQPWIDAAFWKRFAQATPTEASAAEQTNPNARA